MSSPLNLLLIFADQMRGMDMGCAGNRQVRTPNMDRLAAEGVRAAHALATTPVCGPNRATLLTGLFPPTHTVIGNDLPLPTRFVSLGKALRDAGWQTAYVGKWHLDGVPRDRFTPPGERRHGFELWAASNCTHDYFHPMFYQDRAETIRCSGYEPVVQTDILLQFLKERDRSRPFAALLSWGPPHDPYDQVPDRFLAAYPPESIELRPNAQPGAANPLAAGLDCRTATAGYYAAITALDEQLGRILDYVAETGQARQTLAVFTSDHGDMLWSHGLLKKQTPYEEAIAVPLILRWPGILPEAFISPALIGTVDLMPTLLSFLGVPCPTGTQGRDLSSALLGERMPDSAFLGSYLACDEAEHQGLPEWRAVRTHRYTYAEQPGRKPWLFFDNAEDPYQERNLAGGPHPALPELRTLLDGWLQAAHDPFLSGPAMLKRLGLEEAWRTRERALRGNGAERQPTNPTTTIHEEPDPCA